MEMKIFFVALICLVPVAAFAADAPPPGDKDLSITVSDCQKLVDYQPSADVDYKPGVDVNGKPVAPADLATSATAIKPPEKISFPLKIDVAKYIGLTVPAGVQGKTVIGTIAVENGQVTFNGKPLEGDATAALKALCAAKKPQNSTNGAPAAPK